jgi:hypothetical protein
MTTSHRHPTAAGHGTIAPSRVIWNTVVPALAVALLLGAPLLLALAVAAAVSAAIAASSAALRPRAS